MKADDIVNDIDKTLAPSADPVRSRSVTHRVTRRRRAVADGSPSSVEKEAAQAVTAADADHAEPDAAGTGAGDTGDTGTGDAGTAVEDTGAGAGTDARPAPRRKRRYPVPARAGADRRPPTGARRERQWRTTTAVLAVLLVAVTVAGTVIGLRWNDRRETADGLRDALAAGRQSAVNFMSLSVATIDRDMQRIIDGATGDFKQEYERNKATFRNQVVENKAESTCTVLRSATLSGDRDSAVVLIAMDATVKNVSTPNGRLAHYRLQLDVVKDRGSGRWLVSRLQFVG